MKPRDHCGSKSLGQWLLRHNERDVIVETEFGNDSDEETGHNMESHYCRYLIQSIRSLSYSMCARVRAAIQCQAAILAPCLLSLLVP